MAAADYRLMTEATGQRIAAALEALSGTGAAAAAARANLDVYSTGETDELIAQSTADVVWEADKNSSYYGIIDPDDYTTNGFYQVGINTDGSNRYGILLVFVGNGGHVQQLFLSNYELYARSKNSASSAWTTWRSLEGGVLHNSDVVNNLTSTATNKPLSAAMGKALKDSIWDFSTLTTASAGSSATFTLAAGTRCSIFADGINAGVQGIIIAACNGSGTDVFFNKLGASNLSVSKSAASITIANSASADAQLFAIIWRGSIT